jgi:hypothetical protein
MAYGLAGAHREELKDKQLLSLRTELRSYRLNGSGMNKIVRSTSATPWGIKRSNVHVLKASVRDHSLRELSATALLSERNRGGRLASFLARENNRVAGPRLAGLPEGCERRTLSPQLLPDLRPFRTSCEFCSCVGCRWKGGLCSPDRAQQSRTYCGSGRL